ncbi:MAG TPA: tetratricopeptide repeat protein, partial [Rhizobacter sp.]|nr:tetratricopeptide repeat protein [Rhizobacter sp.]
LLRKGWSQIQVGLKDDPALRAEVARPLGLMLQSSGDMVAATAALSMSRDHLVATGQVRTRQYLQVLQNLAYMHSRVGRADEAKTLLREIISISKHMNDAATEETVDAQIQLGEIARREGELTQARAQLAAAASEARERLGTHHRLYVLALQEQADVMRELGDWAETKRLLASIVGVQQSGKPNESLIARFNLATLDVELGNYRQAATELREVTRGMGTLFGPQDTFAIYSGTWLAVSLFHTGAFAESDAAITVAYQAATQTTEPNVRHSVQVVMARQLLRRGRCSEAEPLLRESLAQFEAGEATSKPFAERARMLLAECALRGGHADQALSELNRVVQNQRAFYGDKHLDLWPSLLLQALATDASQGIAAARGGYEQATAMALAMLPPEHPDRLRALVYKNQSLWRADRSPEARQALVAALQAYGNVLSERPDGAGYSVLSKELLEQGPAAKPSLAPLLALLSY